MTDKIGVTELNAILLSSMPNIWYKKVHFQGFDWESISFKNSISMFGSIEIAEILYEDAVTPSYKNIIGQKTTVLELVGKREENTPRQTLAPQRMGALASAVNDMAIAQISNRKNV